MDQIERQPLLNPIQHAPKTTLTPASAYILVISRVIGSGIFATPGSIFRSSGSIGLSLLIWIVGTVLAACGLTVSMEWGTMFPHSGGDKVYVEYAFPRPRFLASTLIAVQAVLLGFTASNCIVFAKYTLFALGAAHSSKAGVKILAIGLLTAITVCHGCFPRVGIAVQNVLGWVKIALIAAMSLTGLWVILWRPSSPPQSPVAWHNLWEGSNWSWNLMSTSLFKVIYSYAGLSNVNNVLAEVHRPVETLRTVCPAALITAAGLYLLANASYFLVIPADDIKQGGELVGALLFDRLFGPHIGRVAFPLAIAISAGGNVMVVVYALVCTNFYLLSRHTHSYSRLLSSSKPFGSPLGGLIVHYIPSILVIALPPQGDVYNFILDVEGYPAQILALAVTVGLLLLRRREPDRLRPFKAWLPAVWLRILVCIALLVAPLMPPPDRKGDVQFFYATYAIVGSGVLVLGWVYWYIWTVVLPRRGGYRLEEAGEVLDDGTKITTLVRV